ncbi:MAG: (Z)-2-((N-methylformamido)methylene)-5-hydroxybutyrolactone dehydrogenase [Thermoleophilaceae bacterium]|nr:(Z)-2-((N-methylformamido)methylene)-5-hydroxybutyrolactone dehydrogenase [Thermoleophilaceae bacterium]
MDRYELFIDGGFSEPAEGDHIASVNPTTGQPCYEFADASAVDVDRAVRSARRVFADPAWRHMRPLERSRLLRRIAEVADAIGPELAAAETTDNGKLIREMQLQHKLIPTYWEYFAGWPDKLHGLVAPVDRPTTLNYIRPEPIGVVGVIVPWNSPLLLTTMKMAPALAAGNTVVVKPSEHTSASMLKFVAALEGVGLPPGALNVVTGLGETAGAALVEHPGVDLITFTGGTETAAQIGAVAARRAARTVMELGGKSPNIVFEDADLESAASGVIAGIFAAAGQTCIAGSRCLVHRSVYDELVGRIADRVSSVTLGDPLDEATDVGPVAFEAQLQKVLGYIELGREEGATVRTGGGRPADAALEAGLFVEPTMLENVRNEMRVAQEEIFGPVLSIMPFADEDEAVRIANDTRFGLAAGVWTRSLSRAHRVAHLLDAGTVWVNTYRAQSPLVPTGGFKASGYGKENGMAVMHEYTRDKSVWVNLSEDPAPDPFVINL